MLKLLKWQKWENIESKGCIEKISRLQKHRKRKGKYGWKRKKVQKRIGIILS